MPSIWVGLQLAYHFKTDHRLWQREKTLQKWLAYCRTDGGWPVVAFLLLNTGQALEHINQWPSMRMFWKAKKPVYCSDIVMHGVPAWLGILFYCMVLHLLYFLFFTSEKTLEQLLYLFNIMSFVTTEVSPCSKVAFFLFFAWNYCDKDL